MRTLVFAVAGSAALMCAAALADGEWQTVSLAGDFTIDVPAAVGAKYVPARRDQGALMAYTLWQGDNYSGCWLSKLPYTKAFTRRTAIDHLKVKERLCNAFNPDASKLHVLQWGPKSSNGQPAAGCVFSYTLAKGLARGGINQNLMIAAPDGAYLLLCLAHTGSQGDAEKQWPATWSAPFAHIAQSLHLPKPKT